MKLLLVINVADDVAEDYKNFTVDYDLSGEDEDGDIVSIHYVEDCPLKSMPEMSGLVHQDVDGWCKLSEYSRGWNACLEEIEKC